MLDACWPVRTGVKPTPSLLQAISVWMQAELGVHEECAIDVSDQSQCSEDDWHHWHAAEITITLAFAGTTPDNLTGSDPASTGPGADSQNFLMSGVSLPSQQQAYPVRTLTRNMQGASLKCTDSRHGWRGAQPFSVASNT